MLQKNIFPIYAAFGSQSVITRHCTEVSKVLSILKNEDVVRVSQNWLTRENSPGAKPMKQVITQTTNFHVEEMKERQWCSLERLYGRVSLTGNTPGERDCNPVATGD